jgi:hypothetical protein
MPTINNAAKPANNTGGKNINTLAMLFSLCFQRCGLRSTGLNFG